MHPRIILGVVLLIIGVVFAARWGRTRRSADGVIGLVLLVLGLAVVIPRVMRHM